VVSATTTKPMDDPWQLFSLLRAIALASESVSLDYIAAMTALPHDLELRRYEAGIWRRWLVRESEHWMPRGFLIRKDGTMEYLT